MSSSAVRDKLYCGGLWAARFQPYRDAKDYHPCEVFQPHFPYVFTDRDARDLRMGPLSNGRLPRLLYNLFSSCSHDVVTEPARTKAAYCASNFVGRIP